MMPAIIFTIRKAAKDGRLCAFGFSADAIRPIACYSSFVKLHLGRAKKPLS
ncbi:hypothetical protein OAG43_01740 [Verrucomicrobia bacterium]|nr:hypothetical protein [Verrucomicrobiota bacterium]